MNGFRCNITGATSTVPIATSRVPRRCGADPDFKKPDAAPWNCTYGAKQPFYWFQNEQNNVRPPSTHLFVTHCKPTDTLYDRCSKAHTPHRSTSTFTGSTTAVRMTSLRTLRSRHSTQMAAKQASRPGERHGDTCCDSHPVRYFIPDHDKCSPRAGYAELVRR